VAYRQGLINNLGNPKIAVFFTSLLPPFTGAAHPSFLALLALGLLFCLLTLVQLTWYSLAVAKAGDFLRRERIRRVMDGITGAVLVGLGVRLAAEHR
jgi:threonine/homoserine/homoserine lactone efflux protein